MVLAGPSCTYTEFMEFIDGSNMKGFKGSDMIPLMTVTKKVVMAYVFLACMVLGNSVVSTQTCIDPKFTSETSLVAKIVFGYFVVLAAKFRYYYAWMFADGVVNAAGMGFNGYDENGKALWDKFTNIKPKHIEFATNVRGFLRNWNILTERWLKRIIYDRSSNQQYGVLATSLTSAFWHGFYPGYYLFFISVGFMNLSSRKARRSFHAYFQNSKEKKIFYDILTWLTTHSMAVYIGMPFLLLQLDSGLIHWRSMYFYGHIFILLGFASPWISEALGLKALKPKESDAKVQEITGESSDSYKTNSRSKQD